MNLHAKLLQRQAEGRGRKPARDEEEKQQPAERIEIGGVAIHRPIEHAEQRIDLDA